MADSLKFYFSWVGRTKCRLGARIGDATYSQEFDNDTRLQDALDIVRSRVVRKATGLPTDDEDPSGELQI